MHGSWMNEENLKCRYCDENELEALAINKNDEAVIINQYTDTKEFVIEGLEAEIFIDYCPKCGRKLV